MKKKRNSIKFLKKIEKIFGKNKSNNINNRLIYTITPNIKNKNELYEKKMNFMKKK